MGKRFTKRLWSVHSWLGLVGGLGLLVVGVSGSLLVFHDNVDAWRFPELYRAQPTTAGRQGYDALFASLRRAHPQEKIIGWSPAAEPDATDAILLAPVGKAESRLFHIDPYTGEVRGKPFAWDQSLSGWTLRLHYSLLGGTVGTFLAGLLGALLLLLGVSGVWLYRGFWRNFLTLRWDRSSRIFFSDLHKMVGISSAAFNLILGLTGAWWNLNSAYSQWAAPAAPPAAAPATSPPLFNLGGTVSLDAMVARAEHELPGYGIKYIALPPEQEGMVTFYGTVPTPNPLRGDFGSRLVFNAKDGALKQVVDVRNAGFWEKIGDSFALLHYGTFGAIFGPAADVLVKAIWTLLGLSPGVLAVSGFLIWWKRRRKRVFT